MNTYEFTLKFSLPEDDNVGCIDVLIERLGAAGCDDALAGVGKTGRLALSFSREATSAVEAIFSAVADTKTAVPGAKLVEATPDLVGLTDVADIVGCSRQYLRKLMLASGRSFPEPVHDGKAALWRMFKILFWLKENKRYDIEDKLLEVAMANMQLNIERELSEIDDWNATNRTPHPLSIPHVRESIREGFETPLDECDGEPG